MLTFFFFFFLFFFFLSFRYGNWANDTYTADKIAETYTHNNKVTYGSYENRSGGRDAILPLQYPLHSVLDTQHGAVFGSFGASGIEGNYQIYFLYFFFVLTFFRFFSFFFSFFRSTNVLQH